MFEDFLALAAAESDPEDVDDTGAASSSAGVDRASPRAVAASSDAATLATPPTMPSPTTSPGTEGMSLVEQDRAIVDDWREPLLTVLRPVFGKLGD